MGTRLFKQLVASYPTKEQALRRFIQAYLASVSSVDEQIGRILDAVDESGLKDSTMIIVTSDHGWGMGEKDYLYRLTLAGKHQVPLWVSAPGISRRMRCEQPVSRSTSTLLLLICVT